MKPARPKRPIQGSTTTGPNPKRQRRDVERRRIFSKQADAERELRRRDDPNLELFAYRVTADQQEWHLREYHTRSRESVYREMEKRPGDRHFYEHTKPDTRCCLYADIDDFEPGLDEATMITRIEKALEDLGIPLEGLLIDSACGLKRDRTYKASFHVFQPSVCFNSIADQKRWWQSKGEKVLGKNAYRVGGIIIDANVYRKGFFRLTHNRKLKDDRVLRPVGVSGILPFQEWCKRSVRFVREDARLIEVKPPSALRPPAARSHSASISRPAAKPAGMSPAELLARAMEFTSLSNVRHASGNTFVASGTPWNCPYDTHVKNKTVYIYEDHIWCPACDKGFSYNTALAHPLANAAPAHRLSNAALALPLANEADIDQMVVAKRGNITRKSYSKWTITYYFAPGAPRAYYNIDSGVLTYIKDDSKYVRPMFPAPPDEIKLRQDTPPDTTVKINDNGREITMDGRYLPTMAIGDDTRWDGGILHLNVRGTYVIPARMGLGKTYTTRQVLADQVRAGRRILIPTYRVSLSGDIHRNLREYFEKREQKLLAELKEYFRDQGLGDKVVHYKDVDKAPDGPGVFICQLESLHKAQDSYDIVVIDELQGLCAEFASTTFTNYTATNAWRKLRTIMRTAMCCIVTDADFERWIPERPKAFLEHMRGPGYVTLRHVGLPPQRAFFECASKKDLLTLILRALQDDKRVFVASNKAGFCEEVYAVCEEAAITCRTITSKHKLKADEDINEVARTHRCLAISSGSVGCGVSIEYKKMCQKVCYGYFDVAFAYGLPSEHAAPAREWYQSLFRVRDPPLESKCERFPIYFYIGYQGGAQRTVEQKRDVRTHLIYERQRIEWEGQIRSLKASIRYLQLELHVGALDARTALDARKKLDEDQKKLEKVTEKLEKQEGAQQQLREGTDDAAFWYNIDLCSREMIESANRFRAMVLERITDDQHQVYSLAALENPNPAPKATDQIEEKVEHVINPPVDAGEDDTRVIRRAYIAENLPSYLQGDARANLHTLFKFLGKIEVQMLALAHLRFRPPSDVYSANSVEADTIERYRHLHILLGYFSDENGKMVLVADTESESNRIAGELKSRLGNLSLKKRKGKPAASRLHRMLGGLQIYFGEGHVFHCLKNDRCTTVKCSYIWSVDRERLQKLRQLVAMVRAGPQGASATRGNGQSGTGAPDAKR